VLVKFVVGLGLSLGVQAGLEQNSGLVQASSG
jgi:hypothetical protein